MPKPASEPDNHNAQDDLKQLKTSFSEIGRQLKRSGKIIARQVRAEVEKAKENLSEEQDEELDEELKEKCDEGLKDENDFVLLNTGSDGGTSTASSCESLTNKTSNKVLPGSEQEKLNDEIADLEEKLRKAKAAAKKGAKTSTKHADQKRKSNSKKTKQDKEHAETVLAFALMLVALLMVYSLVFINSCSDQSSSDDSAKSEISESADETELGAICSANITIEVRENFLFSKYDVRAEIDKTPFGTIQHGGKKIIEAELTEGYHDLLLYKPDDREVMGEIEIEVTQGTPVYLVATCSSSSISIDQLTQEEIDERYVNELESTANQPGKTAKHVIGQLEDLDYSGKGYELHCYEDGKKLEDFDREKFDVSEGSIDISDKAIKLILVSNVPVEVGYPMDIAQKVAIVAITNCYASDVFTDDGSSYDQNKFHSYADMSGYYLTVADSGTWEPVDKSTWHVDDMQLKVAGNEHYFQLSADISVNGESYVVDSATVSNANSLSDIENGSSSVGTDKLTAGEHTPYLYVSNTLIADERDTAAEQAATEAEASARNEQEEYDDWVSSKFSFWTGSNRTFVNLVKDRLNDKRSFEHEETSYIACNSDENLNLVNSTLSAAGLSTANRNDVYIVMDFTAKNEFNARVKQQAHGIIRYPSGDVELLAVI
ncbi:MAG: hypothetical protein ACLT5H_05810 [Collinsella stercoris]|uniref:hypothetical protein n=1 Tax=Collinsella stercoris TaxID=147206 RepID=UPI0039925C59